MKTIFKNIAFFLLATMIMSSCTEDMNFKDASVAAVAELYAPDNGKTVELISAESAALFFEWEAVRTEDSGAPLYEIVFDKKGGNFSTPIYRIASENKGMRNFANVSHSTLNMIWQKAGVEAGETGTLIWSVVSSRGMNEALASQLRELTVKRLMGFAEIPNQVLITGDGTETGIEVEKALPFAGVAQGKFEIFTKLTAGKTYKLITNKDAQVAKSFYIVNNVLLKEGDETVSVTKTGVYNIQLDFNTAAVKIEEVKSIGLWHCWDRQIIFETEYVGHGVWSKTDLLDFGDDRYKMEMELVKADGSSYKQAWGTVNATDGKPSSEEGAYYHTKRVPNNDPWADKWKFMDGLKGTQVEVSISFEGDKPYTHSFTKK